MPIPRPEAFTIRPAVREDERAIRAMIRREGLNPFGFRWQNFLVAEDPPGRIIGIGAVKAHGDGSRELASIAVAEERRGRGIADSVVRRILERERGHPGGLYLTCRAEMAAFYRRYGFREIGIGEMPPYFRRLWRLVSFLTKALRRENRLTVMRRENEE